MARYTNDIPAVYGANSIPNPDPATRQETFSVWGFDVRSLFLTTSAEFALTVAGNPNGLVESNYAGRTIFDTVGHDIWICSQAGTAGTAVWINYTAHVASQVAAAQGDEAVAMAIALG